MSSLGRSFIIRAINALFGRKLMQLILGPTSYLAIQNYLECEAHHELFLRGVKNINKKIMDTKIVAAAKWSVITEVLAKLITPLTNIILAHMLAPTAFGILATIMMVISFAEMLADAGFQKFLVQHEFESAQEKARGHRCGLYCQPSVFSSFMGCYHNRS